MSGRTAMRSMPGELNRQAGGASRGAGNVIVPGTPPSGESDNDVVPVTQAPPPPPPVPMGPFNLHPPVARDPRPGRPFNPTGGALLPVPVLQAALKRRADVFTTEFPEQPRKRRRGEQDVDESDDLNELKARAQHQKSDGEFLVEQKKLLLDCLKTEFASIRDHCVLSDAVIFGAKLLKVVEADTKNVENMAEKSARVDSAALSNEKEWITMVDASDVKLQDSKDYTKTLVAYNKEGVSIVEALLADVATKAAAAKKAASTAKKATDAAQLKHLATKSELQECKALLGKRTEVLTIFKQVSVVPYCSVCMAKIGFGTTTPIYRMSCGKSCCLFCKNGHMQRCDCASSCTIDYEIAPEDYFSEIEFTRWHVMDNYESSVVDCQDQYETVPAALDAFRLDQHERLHRKRA